MPKKITATTDDQNAIIDKIKDLVFGEKNFCILYELDQRSDLQVEIDKLLPEIRSNFLIHNVPGVQRPDSLKRPWLSVMRTFLKKKYTIVSENYLLRLPDQVVATKRYILLPKDVLSVAEGNAESTRKNNADANADADADAE